MIDIIVIDENNTLLIAKHSMPNRRKTKELIRELVTNYIRTTDIRSARLIHKEYVPYIVDRSGDNLANCSFSYAGNYAIAFISNNRRVGIDIELCDRVNKVKGIIFEYFKIDEKFNSCKSTERFMWSLHEALGKLEKVGIFSELRVLDVESCKENQHFIDKFTNKRSASELFDFLCYKSSSINKMVDVTYQVKQGSEKKVAICYLLQTKEFYLVVALEKLQEVS